MTFGHQPVLFKEVLDYLVTDPRGIYVDGTVGGAGHALGIIKRLGGEGRLIALDRDPQAVEWAEKRLAPYRSQVEIVKENFINMDFILKINGISAVDGILLDLGVSSPQLDRPERGFSYMADGPLDMRMDPLSPKSARELVNGAAAEELEEILDKYGEERWAKRIAEFIVRERQLKPLKTTAELVAVVEKAIPRGAREKGSHPAKRTFQALRIAVNDELGNLFNFLESFPGMLKTGGRIAVISFHSLEDRMVKESFRNFTRSCVCPPGQPVCTCNTRPVLQVLTKKPVTASRQEKMENPRSHSAKLRVAEKI